MIDAFLRLVEVDDEGTVTGADVVLDDVPAEVRDIFEDLERFRLVTRDQRIVAGSAAPVAEEAGGRSVEVARAVHEEVFRAWPAVTAAIKTRRTDLETRTWLRHDAQAWDTSGRKESALTGGRLDVARSWRERNKGELTPVVDEFITQSRRQQSRRRALTFAVPILAVVALAVGVLAFQAFSEAQRANAAREEADALRLAGDARANLDSRPDFGLLLAIEAAARSDAPQVQGMSLSALTHGPGPRQFQHVGKPVERAALDRAGSHAILRSVRRNRALGRRRRRRRADAARVKRCRRDLWRWVDWSRSARPMASAIHPWASPKHADAVPRQRRDDHGACAIQ